MKILREAERCFLPHSPLSLWLRGCHPAEIGHLTNPTKTEFGAAGTALAPDLTTAIIIVVVVERTLKDEAIAVG